MKLLLKLIGVLFIMISYKISFCQDTATATFRITKIYATAAGLTSGTVNRDELIDSGGIVIHGCNDCYVLGFKLVGKSNQNPVMDSSNNSLAINGNNMDSIIRPIDPRLSRNVFLSKNDRFTLAMKKYIWNTNNFYLPYYIEITDITVVMPGGKEATLDKLCFYFND